MCILIHVAEISLKYFYIKIHTLTAYDPYRYFVINLTFYLCCNCILILSYRFSALLNSELNDHTNKFRYDVTKLRIFCRV